MPKYVVVNVETGFIATLFEANSLADAIARKHQTEETYRRPPMPNECVLHARLATAADEERWAEQIRRLKGQQR